MGAVVVLGITRHITHAVVGLTWIVTEFVGVGRGGVGVRQLSDDEVLKAL